jgi:hypothetical protein
MMGSGKCSSPMLPFTAAMDRIRIASDHMIMAFIRYLVGVHDRLQSRELEDVRGRQQILHWRRCRLTSHRSFLISSRDRGSAFAFGSPFEDPQFRVSRLAFRISPSLLTLPKPVHGAFFSWLILGFSGNMRTTIACQYCRYRSRV